MKPYVFSHCYVAFTIYCECFSPNIWLYLYGTMSFSVIPTMSSPNCSWGLIADQARVQIVARMCGKSKNIALYISWDSYVLFFLHVLLLLCSLFIQGSLAYNDLNTQVFG